MIALRPAAIVRQGKGNMASVQDYKPAELLQFGQRAEADGNLDYALRIYAYLAEQFQDTAEGQIAFENYRRVDERIAAGHVPANAGPVLPPLGSSGEAFPRSTSGTAAGGLPAGGADAGSGSVSGRSASGLGGSLGSNPLTRPDPQTASPRSGDQRWAGAARGGGAATDGLRDAADQSAGFRHDNQDMRPPAASSLVRPPAAHAELGGLSDHGSARRSHRLDSHDAAHDRGRGSASGIADRAGQRPQSGERAQAPSSARGLQPVSYDEDDDDDGRLPRLVQRALEEDSEPIEEAFRKRYRVGKVIALVMAIGGWLLVLAGLAAIVAVWLQLAPQLVSPGRGVVAAGIVIGGWALLSGVVMIFIGQLSNAVFDNANATRQLLAIEKAKARS